MPEFFRLQSVDSISVVELELPDSIDAMEFDRMNEAILGLLKGKATEGWVLDLGKVDYMGSAMLGLIVNVRQRIKTAGGKLVLCSMSEQLTEIFRMCSMERLFTICKTRADALNSLER